MTDTTPAAVPLADAAPAAVPSVPARRIPRPGTLTGMSAIVVRELRARMRGKRAFIFLTFYLLVLGGLLWLALSATQDAPMGALDAVAFGRGIFGGIVLIETVVVAVLAAAYTAGSISQEREKQTFDLLAVTPISSLAIVVGKLVSSLSFLAVIVGASLPLAAFTFFFGGTAVEDMVIAYVIIALTGVGVGALGVLCSAVFRKSQPATVAALVGVAILTIGSSGAWIAMDANARERSLPRPPVAILLLNPFVAQADLLCSTTNEMCLFSSTDEFAPVGPAGGGAAFVPQPTHPPLIVPGTFWPASVAAWAIAALAFVFGAAQAVSPTRRTTFDLRSRLRRPRQPVAPDAAADPEAARS
ncbi:MAG TPA: ABC transporter permease subunit [Candidatus Limnocylindrales bacterium]|nr:ABC transporter permease subunit [Candidatus Limnocylindrales bacterium]